MLKAVPVGLPISIPADGKVEARLRNQKLWELLGDEDLGIFPIVGSFGPTDGRVSLNDFSQQPPWNSTMISGLFGKGAVYVSGNSFMVDKAAASTVAERAVWLRSGGPDRLAPLDEKLIEAVGSDLGAGKTCSQPETGDPRWEDFLCCAEGCREKECCFGELEDFKATMRMLA